MANVQDICGIASVIVIELLTALHSFYTVRTIFVCQRFCVLAVSSMNLNRLFGTQRSLYL